MERGRGRHRRGGGGARRPHRGRGSGGDREYAHRGHRGPPRDNSGPSEVPDAGQTPEVAAEELSQPVFSKRKVLSNWDRYEAAEKAAEVEGQEEVSQRGTDYHVLLSSAGDSFSQFRLAEEKDWGGGGDGGCSVLLDGQALARALQGLPLHLRLNVEADGVQEELPQELPYVRAAPLGANIAPLGVSRSTPGANFRPLGAIHPTPGANITPLGASLPTLGANTTPLGAIHPTLGANVTPFEANLPTLGANTTPFGENHPTLEAKITPFEANRPTLGANVTPVGSNPSPVVPNLPSQGANLTPQSAPEGLDEELDFLLSLEAPIVQTEAPDQQKRPHESSTAALTDDTCKAAEEKAQAVTAEDLEDWLDSMIA